MAAKFSVKRYVADKQLEPFPFEDINGELRELPNLLLMTAPQVDEIMTLMDVDPAGAFSLIAPEMSEAVKSTPVAALIPLAQAYIAHCMEGTEGMGESVASSSSQTSTTRQSKRTSPASTRARTQKK